MRIFVRIDTKGRFYFEDRKMLTCATTDKSGQTNIIKTKYDAVVIIYGDLSPDTTSDWWRTSSFFEQAKTEIGTDAKELIVFGDALGKIYALKIEEQDIKVEDLVRIVFFNDEGDDMEIISKPKTNNGNIVKTKFTIE